MLSLDPDHSIRTDMVSKVCKNYQQTTLGDKELTLKAPFTTAADTIFTTSFPIFEKNKDDSREISCLICYF